jgi:hypothetical protein
MGTSGGGARSKYDAGYGRGMVEIRENEHAAAEKEAAWSVARGALKLPPIALNALRKDARGILEKMEQS